MNKKCAVYREILYQKRVHGQIRFTQKELASTLGISTSTVFNALKSARDTSIIRVTGRFFVLQDYRKLLYLFATERSLIKDMMFSLRLEKGSFDIEAAMPPAIAFGLYSATQFLLSAMPTEYDHVYVYADRNTCAEIRDRVRVWVSKKNSGLAPNFFVIEKDPLFSRYPQPLLEQVFADIWNAPEWYAKDILPKLEELLS
ncbi:winged helix-turn-helix domain-containing protein [Candidatus Uhrbacteria bacterium]|nr:winged helix-turn-helix domain-containing protein [Candidatus Uhrbacteria bacterium]